MPHRGLHLFNKSLKYIRKNNEISFRNKIEFSNIFLIELIRLFH